MAHLRYNSNENKGIIITLKAGDLGLFDGIPLKKINETKTKEVISQSPIVSQDTFIKDLIVENKNNQEEMETNAAAFSKIPQNSEVIGATIQPLITSANVEIGGRNFQVYFSNKNNSGGTKASVLKLYESIGEGDEKQLKEIDLSQTRVTFKNIKESIDEILKAAINLYQNGNTGPLTTMYIDLPKKYGKRDESGNDISKFWGVDENGQTYANIDYANIIDFVKIALETDRQYIATMPDNEAYKNAMNTLIKFKNNENINLITMSARLIQYNDPDVEKVGIKINSTKIEEAEFIMANKDDSLTITTSAFSKSINETDIEKFKSTYVNSETRSNMENFINEAKKDPYVAYHLMLAIESNLRPHLQEVGKLIKEPNPTKLAAESKAINAIIEPIKQTFPSIGFSGKYFADKFGKGEEAKDIFQFANNFTKIFKNKIVSSINYINDFNKITLTKDGSRIKGSANGVSMFYDGTLPIGMGIAKINKSQDLKGSMSKENILTQKLEIANFFIPTRSYINKDTNEAINIPPRVLFPNNSKTLSKELIDVLRTIATMNNNGELAGINGSTYSAKIEEKIDKLLKRANGDGDKKEPELENKIYIKTKGAISDALSLLASSKKSPEDLKKVLMSPKLDDALKLAAKRKLEPNYAFNSYLDSVARNNQFAINKALQTKGDDGHSVYVSYNDVKNNDVRKYVNKVLGEFYDKDQAFSYTLFEYTEREDNPLYDSIKYGPINPAIKKPIGKTKEDKEFMSPDNFMANYKIGDNLGEPVKKETQGGEDYEMNIPLPSKASDVLNQLLQNNMPESPMANLKKYFNQEYKDISSDRKEEFKNNIAKNSYIQPSFKADELLKMAQEQNQDQLSKVVADINEAPTEEPQTRKRGRPSKGTIEIINENQEIVAINANNENSIVEAQLENFDFGEIASNPYDDYVPNMDDNEINFGDDMGYSFGDDIEQELDENNNNKFKL
jgi:hypothetical protein